MFMMMVEHTFRTVYENDPIRIDCVTSNEPIWEITSKFLKTRCVHRDNLVFSNGQIADYMTMKTQKYTHSFSLMFEKVLVDAIGEYSCVSAMTNSTMSTLYLEVRPNVSLHHHIDKISTKQNFRSRACFTEQYSEPAKIER